MKNTAICTLLFGCAQLPVYAESFDIENQRLEEAKNVYLNAGGYGCDACHGEFANGAGNVGGNIRQATQQDIANAFEQEPTMRLLGEQMSEQDKRLAGEYLQYLGELELIEWVINSDSPSELILYDLSPSKRYQLVVQNTTLNQVNIDVAELSPKKHSLISIPAYGSFATVLESKHQQTLQVKNLKLQLTKKNLEETP